MPAVSTPLIVPNAAPGPTLASRGHAAERASGFDAVLAHANAAAPARTTEQGLAARSAEQSRPAEHRATPARPEERAPQPRPAQGERATAEAPHRTSEREPTQEPAAGSARGAATHGAADAAPTEATSAATSDPTDKPADAATAEDGAAVVATLDSSAATGSPAVSTPPAATTPPAAASAVAHANEHSALLRSVAPGTTPGESARAAVERLPEQAVAHGARESMTPLQRPTSAPVTGADAFASDTSADAAASSATPASLPPFAAALERQARSERAMVFDTASAGVTNAPSAAAIGVALATATTAGSGPAPVLHVATPVGHADFAAAFAQRVQIVVGRHVSSAELTLTPQDLGPVQIAIEVRGQDANVLMQAAHPATRAALEEALPKLREMFAEQGLRLADAQVGQQAPHDARGDGTPGHGARGSLAQDGTAGRSVDAVLDAEPSARRLDRLIDVVA